MASYNGQGPLPVWWLIDGQDNVVASFRAETALEARDEFKRQGLSGVRVTRAGVAPVDEQARPAGAFCENPNCRAPIVAERDVRFVTGWEAITRNGAGGTHAIRAPDRSAERFMCRFCIDKLASGVSLDQQVLVVDSAGG